MEDSPALKYAKMALSRARIIEQSAEGPCLTEMFLIDDLEKVIRFLTPKETPSP